MSRNLFHLRLRTLPANVAASIIVSLIVSPVSVAFAAVDSPPIESGTDVGTSIPDSANALPDPNASPQSPLGDFFTPIPPDAISDEATELNTPDPLLPEAAPKDPVSEDVQTAEESLAAEDSDLKPLDTPEMSALSAYSDATGDRVRYAETPQAKVDNATGALVQEVPIQIPPGRNGMEPSLAMVYNSQQYKDNPIGFGWSISIPYIERLNRVGVDTMYSDNYFSSSQYGELASSTDGYYHPRVENGDFVKFRLSNNTWTAYEKNGVQYKYGHASSTQLFSLSTTTETGKWMLEEARDQNNNYVKYTYAKSDNYIYPSTVVYTGNGTTDGIYTVTFSKQTRPDPSISYEYGFLMQMSDRINQISIAASGTPVRSYALAYSSGNNGYRSLLSTVTETYYDQDGSSTTLAPWQFSYTNTPIGYTYNSSLNNDFYSPAYVYSDINGDALTDAVVAFSDAGVVKNDKYFNDAGTLQQAALITAGSNDIQVPWATNGTTFYSFDQGVRLMDINGDMWPDVVKSYSCAPNCGGSTSTITFDKRYFLNTGATKWTTEYATTSFSVIEADDSTIASAPHQTKAIIGNVDGDTTQEIYPYNAQYYGNGYTHWLPNFAQLTDLNNDGLDDLTSNVNGAVTVSINTGNTSSTIIGTTASTSFGTTFTFSGGTSYEDSIDKGIRVFDVNNDGLPDLVRAYRFDGPLNYYGSGVDLLQDNASTTEIWLNTGVSWTKMVSPPYIPTIANPYVIGGYWWGNERVLELADIDGDGGVDMNNYKNNASRQDLLRRVVLPTGGWIDATTTPTAKHTTSSHPTHANLPMNVWTVTDFTTNDGFGNTETHSYNYQGGLLWYGGVNDRKFAGFSSVKDTFDGGYTISYFHQGSTTESSAGEYADMYAKIGKPYRTETYQNGSGDPITVSIYKWDQATTSFSTLFPKLVQKIDMSYDANSDHRDTAETYTYNDNTGDITQKKEWGEVTASSDGTFSDTGSDLFTTDYTYATDASSTAVYLSTESRTDQSAASTSESRYYYDNQALGTVTLGNRTKVERRIDASNFASTTRAYNAYGLPTLDRDENYASTTYSYDIYNLYPATSTNAIGQNTFYQYNYLLGKVGTTTDANGQVWVTRYDGRGRLIKEEAPDPTTAGSRVTKASYIYNDTPLSVSVHKSDYLDATNTIESFKYVDGFGRAIQTKQEAENSNWIEKDMSYDSRGRLYRESLPYFTASSSRDTATTSSALFATYLYDPLGRVKELGTVVGTTTTTYDQWKKSVTNPLSKVMAYYNDAYNNLARVDENNGTSTYSTYYVWDGNRALTSITDALSNVRTFTYDKLGRRTQATDLHASGDGTYGTYSYTYDKAGNMTVKTTPVGATINYTYDALNRLKTEDYTGQSGTEVTYVYDSCTMGTGQLCTASTSAATTTYTYTPQGKVKTEAKAISGTTYTTQYAYDRAGNMTLLTYPDNAQAQYTYNGGGQIETVQKKENGESSFANIVTNFDYSPVGQPTSIAYANGATTTNTYNPSALYRLSNKLSVLPGSSRAQDISYTYDALGNITQINDQSATGAGKVVNYGYDDLSRMLTASTTAASSSPYAYTYAYNALGNITNGPLGAYSYTGNTGSSYANPHAVTTIGTTTGSSAATTTIHTVYAESLTPGWADWSWSTTLDSANTSPVKTGTYSLKSTHTVAWGGMYLHNTGLGTATSTHLSFSVRSPNAGAYIELEAYGPSDVLLGNVQLNSYIPGGSLAADTWYDVAIPLADLHATSTTLTGIVAMRSTTGSEYWDDMKLVNVTAGSGGSASTTLAYDQNGNLTSDGALTYTWDYRNRLTQTTTGTTTSTYTYDHADSRVKLVEGSVTTLFPNKFYNAMIGGAATTTKHIFAGNLLLATVENASSTGGSSGGGTATSTPTLDATSTSITTGFATGPVTKTWTHTVATAGTSTILILYGDIWQDVGGSGTITSAKWNGGSFTKLGNARSGGMATELWYLVPTTTGAKTMSVTVTGATDAIKLAAASFTGISTTTTVDATSTATGTTGNPTISVTTHAVGNLVTATLSRFSTTDATTNRTSLYKDKVTSTLGAASYQVATATGSYSDTYTGSANQDWSTIMGTFRAATTSTATSSGSTASSTVRYMLADHLGSTNVITNASGTVVEVLDYLPYGETRMDTKTGSYVGEKRKYIGQELDGGTGLSYLNARYYNNSRGNFASEDPVFWGKQQLENPQSMNSYGYAGRNPISQLDDSGKAFYYFTDGHVEFHGTTGYTHTESGDNAYFAGNAGEMERQSGSLQAYNTFYNHVHSGGDWDFKSAHDAWQSDGFIFGGKWYNAEDSGNLNYGYTGTAAGIGPSILTDVAGLVQVKNSLPVGTHTNNGISFSNARYNFDDAGDNLMILKGINMYLQTRANANSVSSMNAQESSYIGTRTAGLTPQSTLKLMSAALAIASKTVQLLKAATDAGK